MKHESIMIEPDSKYIASLESHIQDLKYHIQIKEKIIAIQEKNIILLEEKVKNCQRNMMIVLKIFGCHPN